MKAVGIKVLKNNLSKYLSYVRQGTPVYVTDRDEIIAEIRKPVAPVEGKISKFDAYLNQLEQDGLLIRRAKPAKQSAAECLKEFRKKYPPTPVEDWWPIFQESRKDRF